MFVKMADTKIILTVFYKMSSNFQIIRCVTSWCGSVSCQITFVGALETKLCSGSHRNDFHALSNGIWSIAI